MKELIKIVGAELMQIVQLTEELGELDAKDLVKLGKHIDLLRFKTKGERDAYVKGFDEGLKYTTGWCVCDDEDEYFEDLEDLYERICDEEQGT